jgi:hypothetical protein
MPQQRFQELYDEYAATRYPFLDTCTLLADTQQQLDADLFFDASLYPVGNTGVLYITTITVQSRLVTISIADKSKAVVATASFDPFTVGDVLSITDIAGRPAGVLVSAAQRLSRFSSWVEGTHTFSASAAVFVPSCIIPSPATGVRGLKTPQGDVLTNTVVLVGGAGVVLSTAGDDAIRVDIVGDPLYRRRLCAQVSAFKTPLFVQTINGCPPDQNGNINIIIGNQLASKTILRLNQYEDGLIIEANGTAG